MTRNEIKLGQDVYVVIKRLWSHISKKRQFQLLLLLFLMVLTSIAELISIGSVVPFLAVLVNPDKVFSNQFILKILSTIGFNSSDYLLAILTILFAISALAAGLLRLVLMYFQVKLSHLIGAEFSIKIYERTLYQPYIVHLSRNSSEVIGGIINKSSSLVQNALYPLLTILSNFLMLLMILGMLLIINPTISIITFTCFGGIYFTIATFTQKKLKKESEIVSIESNMVVKVLQEGLGGIRDVLLDGTQSVYVDAYKKSDIPLRKSLAYLQILGGSPRFIIEALGLVLISVIAFFLTNPENGVKNAIPVLGALALGAQRLLPVLQQGFSAFTSLRGGHASIIDALDLLDQPIKNLKQSYKLKTENSQNLYKTIKLRNLGFKYSINGPWAFKEISLDLPKGGSIGIVGSTGAGKSTFLDVLMGLLPPTEGEIIIDNTLLTDENMRHWQNCLAHVPQNIYLADTSIAENIAFGVKPIEIDFNRVKKAAESAEISKFIEGLDDGYKTFVGERGVRLSGGQRQRIGIARALYKNANIIILDEATSALDSQTEDAVMNSIKKFSSDATLIIVAHRVSTLKNCQIILEMLNGKLVQKPKDKLFIDEHVFKGKI